MLRKFDRLRHKCFSSLRVLRLRTGRHPQRIYVVYSPDRVKPGIYYRTNSGVAGNDGRRDPEIFGIELAVMIAET